MSSPFSYSKRSYFKVIRIFWKASGCHVDLCRCLSADPLDHTDLSPWAHLAPASLPSAGCWQDALPFVSALLFQSLSSPFCMPRAAPLLWMQVPDPSAEILGIRYISNFRKVTLYVYCILTLPAGLRAAPRNPAHYHFCRATCECSHSVGIKKVYSSLTLGHIGFGYQMSYERFVFRTLCVSDL